MKIDNGNYNIVQDSGAQRVDGGAAQRQEAPREQDRIDPSSDRVNISSASQQIDSLRSAVKAAPDVRTERVNELKAAVQNRTYQVSSRQIADKIIDGEQSS